MLEIKKHCNRNEESFKSDKDRVFHKKNKY